MANRRFLAQTIPWIAERSTNSLVVIGDYPHRHNLIALRGLSPGAALKKALEDGERALRYSCEIAEMLSENVEVCSAADIVETPECRAIHRKLIEYFHGGEGFVKDVVSAALGYVSRVCPGLPPSHATRVLPTLKDYVLEELAMFMRLYELGYPVEVYAGSDLPIMRKVATSKYEGFPFHCSDRTHISICLDSKNYEDSQ